jgi:hypothetical protein
MGEAGGGTVTRLEQFEIARDREIDVVGNPLKILQRIDP